MAFAVIIQEILSEYNGSLLSHHMLVFINDKRIRNSTNTMVPTMKTKTCHRLKCFQNRANEQSNTRSYIKLEKPTGIKRRYFGITVAQSMRRRETIQRPRFMSVKNLIFHILDQSGIYIYFYLFFCWISF